MSLDVAKYSAITSATAVVLTVVYILGLSAPSQVFLLEYFRLQDYINQSFKWLAPVLLCAAIYFAWSQWMLRDSVQNEPDVKESSSPGRVPDWLLMIITIISVVLVLGYTGFATIADYIGRPTIPRQELYILWGIAGPILWGVMVWRYSSIAPPASNWEFRHKVLTFAFGASVIVSLSMGLSRGESISSFKDKSTLDSLVLQEGKSIHGKLVFMLSEFAIVSKFPEGRIEVIPIGEIKSVAPGTHRYQH